jgi:ParB family chromosome partitioning protein
VSSTEGSGGKRRQLGRGLSSLLGDDGDDVAQTDRMRQTRNIAIEQIEPGRAQPRRIFDETELDTLAESIRERGVLQPILVRRIDKGGDRLEIIAGERRWRAAQRAGLHEIPALVREFSDTEALEIALIENIQRSDLTALEEADGFQRLIDEYAHTQEDVARAVGKSRSHVANTLRLLTLPPKAQDYLASGSLTAGHARALLASRDPDGLADYVVAGGLSVRATERLVQGQGKDRARKSKISDRARPRAAPEKDADTLALERSITESLGLTVDIAPRDEGRGALTIHYQSLDQLDDLLARLTSVSAPGMAPVAVSVAMCDASDADDFVFSDHAAEPSADAIDFNALLSQPESFFASEEVAGDLGPIARVGVTSTDDGDESSDHGAASSNPFVSSILGTLDIGGKDTASNTAEPELEQTPDQGSDDEPDEEIASID